MRTIKVAVLGTLCALGACLATAAPAVAQGPQFERVQLVDDSTAPMEVDVAGDGRVFYIERFGAVRVWDPGTESTSTIGSLQLYTGEENGLLGLALAPDFDQSDQLYLHYSVPPEATLTQRVSRFTLDAGGQLDLASEEVIYEFQHQRQTCCHTAGSLEFGPDGSLYISTGDNVNPFESQGYTPIDERPGRSAWDAQRTSANTNDPNGKILRITPNPDAPGYSIPAGNMFAPGTEDTLPEIHSMGFRNPFRFTVDPETGWVLVADYGPDAGQANPQRGPQGSVEYNVIQEPINSGWPYCIRENVPYIDYQFPSGPSGLPFDCDNPVNDSPNNTGLTNLPPSFPATMWQGFTETDDRYPGLGTNGAPMSGPRYSFDPSNPSETKFPAGFDGRWFIASWNNSWIRTVDLDSQGTPSNVQNFPNLGFLRPMDMTFGPDGSLYLAEWGSGGGGGGNANSGVYRIDYTGDLDCGPEPPDPDDEFDGTALDPCRWNEIVRHVPDQLAVRDGALAIDTGNNTDMFGGNTSAENIVLQPAPDGAWEIKTEVTMPFTGKDYEQAGLMVYGGDANWAKLMFIKVPENNGRQVEFTLQQNGSPTFDPGLDRSAFLPASFPDTIHLRLRNNGTSLTAAYSEDGEAWTEFGRAHSQAGIPDPRIGVAAFNGDGSGNEAEFDFFHVGEIDEEPDPCSEPEQPDPGYEMLFDGTEESRSQWQMAGPGGFNLTPQCTLQSFGGLGMLYRNELYEGPVTFRLEWMMPGDDNSGVVVGNWGPNPNYPSGPAWDALDNGYEVQIDATDSPAATTGAIYGIQAANQALRDEALNPPGQWNTYEITVDDPEIIVRLNGAMINHYVHNPTTYPNKDISATKLGVQNHGPGDTIFYRRIQVKEHGPEPSCIDLGVPIDPDDDFSGSELDGCRWNRIVRYDPPGLDVSGGHLNLQSSYADIYTSPNTPVTNMVLQDTPEGDWTAETKVTAPLVKCCQQAGLIAYLDDGNYVKWDVIADDGAGQARFELRSEIDDVVQTPEESEWVDYPGDDTYWLRLTKLGDTYSAAYSLDGSSWTDFGTEVSNSAIADGAAIGLFTLGVFQDAPIWASFDWFTLSGDGAVNNPPVIDAISATPSTGEAPLEVDFSVVASDPDGDELTYGWDFGDGSTSDQQNPTHTYTNPGTYEAQVTVSDGTEQASDSVTVTVSGGTPALRIQGQPRARTVGPRAKQTRFRFLAANIGNAPTGAVRLCATGPKKRVVIKGKRCVVRQIPAGQNRSRPVQVRIKPKARGKVTRIKLVARGANIETQRTSVRLRVR